MDLLSNTVIFGVLFFILIIGYYIFYTNPYHVVDLLKLPLIVFYVITIFCVIIFMEIQLKKNGQFGELFTDFTFYFFKYFNFILILLIFAVISYFIYRGIIHFSLFLLSYSLWSTLGLLIIILALLNEYSSDGTIDNPVLQLIKDIIMYIPCLITDIIEYVKKDYADTPTTTFILFVILLVYIFFVYLLPEISREMYKNDGILLITNPVYLNTDIISLSRDELNNKILNSLPFYDRWTQKMLLELEFKSNRDISGLTQDLSDISDNYTDISENYGNIFNKFNNIIKNKNILNPFSIESFTSIKNNDTQTVNKWNHYLRNTERDLLNKLTNKDPRIEKEIEELAFVWNNQPDLLRAYISYLVLKYPELLDVVDKIQILYSSTFAAGYTILSIPSLFLGNPITNGNLYHYSLSFWVYFNTLETCAKKQTILTFGLKPSLYYSPDKNELTVEINNYVTNKNKIIYKTNEILFQRWNHVVMNYSYGRFDLFINNNLVSTLEIVPVMSPQEILLVGSSTNENVGGICNMKYYNIPLTASKINSIYKNFHNKSTPI